MKLLKKFLAGAALSALSLSLVACDLQKAENKQYENKTTVNNKVEEATDGVTKDGYFEEAKGYTINYKETIKENKTTAVIEYLAEYSFKTDGKVHYKDVKNNIERDYNYKIKDKVITLTTDTTTEYMYYYGNVIVTGDIMSLPGTLDGVAVSQMGASTIGYVATVILNQGDDKGVLTNNADNKNKYYAVKKNGTVSSSGTKIQADQLAKFDTTTKGTYLTTINISGKTYPAIVHVI